MKTDNILFHCGALAILFLVTFFYFKPIITDGKDFHEHDNVQARAMQTEIEAFRAENGTEPLWTNQVFVGMPTYQLKGGSRSNLVTKAASIPRLGYSLTYAPILFFTLLICVYISLLLLKVDPRLACIGAIGFGLMTSNILFMEAGHSVKIYSLAFVAPSIGAAIACFRGKYLLGGFLFGLFFTLNLSANHLQITYYLVFALVFVGLAHLGAAIRKKEIGNFAKAASILIFTGLLGIGSNLSVLWTTYEYAQESTRGKTELEKKETKSGLSKSYANGLNFQKKESFTLMMPYFYGGGQSEKDAILSGNPKLRLKTASQKEFKKLQMNQGKFKAVQAKAQEKEVSLGKFLSTYWGGQTMTGGPMYLGAVLCFLFILGLFLVRGPTKWALALTMGWYIVLSWGDNFFLGDLMYNYFPLYNKFRDLKMTMMLGQIIVALMAVLALKELMDFKTEEHQERVSAKLLTALKLPVSGASYVIVGTAVAASLCVFGVLYSFIGSTASPYDPIFEEIVPGMVEAMQSDRASIMRFDALKSLGFILAAGGLLWAYASKTVDNVWVMILGIAAIICVDLLRVDLHYVNSDNFVKVKKGGKKDIQPTALDVMIMQSNQGKTPAQNHYRVIDFVHGSPSQNSYAAKFHKIVGGYHAAKPMLFQELVEGYFNNPNELLSKNRHILEMLNTRYVLAPSNPQPMPLQACGNAWFVDKVTVVGTADEERDALASLKPLQEAVTRNADYVSGLNYQVDSNATDQISLTSYSPEEMVYTSKASQERFAVFSEMYYPPEKGWKVYIDDQEVEGGFVKVNYLLRGLRIPAGDHKIEMFFSPTSWHSGETITLLSSLLILLGLGFAGFMEYKATSEKKKTV